MKTPTIVAFESDIATDEDDTTSLDSSVPALSDFELKNTIIYSEKSELSILYFLLILSLYAIIDYIILNTIPYLDLLWNSNFVFLIVAWVTVILINFWGIQRFPVSYEIYHDKLVVKTVDQFILPNRILNSKIYKGILWVLGKSRYVVPFSKLSAVGVMANQCPNIEHMLAIHPNTCSSFIHMYINLKKTQSYHRHHLMSPQKVDMGSSPFDNVSTRDTMTEEEEEEISPLTPLNNRNSPMLPITVDTNRNQTSSIIPVAFNLRPINITPKNIRQFAIQLKRAIDDYTNRTHGQMINVNVPDHFYLVNEQPNSRKPSEIFDHLFV